MSAKKFLLVAGSNSLSHVAKCLSVRQTLQHRGQKALLAVSRKHSAFLQQLGVEHTLLPDIQESDGAGLPTVEWFRDSGRFAACLAAESELLRDYRPDLAVGVFRFTLKPSAQLAGIPFYSLACGCILPGTPEVLGFELDSPGCNSQKIVLDGFYAYAAAKASRELIRCGLDPVTDIRSLLLGERTMLWDFPLFCQAPKLPGIAHVGAISWEGWPTGSPAELTFNSGDRPLAVVAFGTCADQTEVAARLVRILVGMGYQVVVAAGGQKSFLAAVKENAQVKVCSFAPLPELFSMAKLLITHGGQMTIFEALRHNVPVAVMPFQPEQAHNGLCLERLGCGKRLIGGCCFQGNSAVYLEAFAARSDAAIAADLVALIADPVGPGRRAEAKAALSGYRGADTVADLLMEH